MLRLFTGISLESRTLQEIGKLLAQLRPLARLGWSPVENLHITTRFIGAWDDARLAELEEALVGVKAQGPVPIRVRGLGYYPNAQKPRVLFAGIAPEAALPGLAASIEDTLAALGCRREALEYSPHLTLARIRNENIDELGKRIIDMSNTEFGTFEAEAFHLYLSKPAAQGSVYTVLRTFPIC